MHYSHRIRRNWRVTVQRQARTGGVLTAARFLALQGAPAEWIKRYAAQITRTAKKAGVVPAAHTWTVRNGRARRTAGYGTDQIAGLMAALFTYGRSRSAVLAGRWS
ncbi:hypothetical protein ABZ752_22630 [Streptomyces roseifaciens]